MPTTYATLTTAIARAHAPMDNKTGIFLTLWMVSSMANAEITIQALSYQERLITRSADAIEIVVIHCTELPDLASAREFGEKIHYPQSRTGNSGHFYIDRDGHTEQWVDPLRVAHHVAGGNENSIGIELVNLGRFPDWFDSRKQVPEEPYPATQITALITLLNKLADQYPNLKYITGHQDLDQRQQPASDNPALMIPRKIDPGPQFPWQQVLSAINLIRPAADG